ncbi:CHAP domain-containing protein [Kitasatospora sp. NPDC056446]|uniref:CHAP domain-containing protein n=1 Tax=Kitasatospora sp. NPDC056446 TaxID=3345819 RepID=UPI003692FF92
MSSVARKLGKTGIATVIAATAMTGLTVLPAHADANGIAATANAELYNGPCAHGGYVPGDGSSNSCAGNNRASQAWCADFAGWVWGRNGAAYMNELTPAAASFFDYGRRHGTLHNDPRVGDAVVYNYDYSRDWAQHVALVVGVGNGTVTILGGNEGHSSGFSEGRVQQASTSNYSVGSAPWGQRISGYISPVPKDTPAANPNPSTLPTGTLVKSASGPDVKVIISGSGVPITASDVAADGYDLNKIVQVDDAAFKGLPTSPPTGTVVHDAAGGAPRYVVINGVALPISASDWNTGGYGSRPDMGVPTSWLKNAVQGTLTSGWVVMDQSGADSGRYVMVNGTALPISGAEWTADGYDQRMLMGVPGDWLRTAAAKPLPNGTVLMDQNGSAERYVTAGGAAAHIAASEWSAEGYSSQPAMAVPGAWLSRAAAAAPADGTLIKGQSGADPSVYVVVRNTALLLTDVEFTGPYAGRDIVTVPEAWEAGLTARPLADGTVVKNVSGTDSSRYVMVGGAAAAISGAEWTADGYDKKPLTDVPGTWLGRAAAAAPADGTLIKGQAGTDPSVYVVVNNSALPLTNVELTGPYAGRAIVGAPEVWEGKLAARPLANGTVVKNVSGTDPVVYVMAGGMAVPLSATDFTAFGYDKRPLRPVPGAWEASAAAKAAPSDGTLLLSPDSNTVWQVVNGGGKKALAASDFGPGKLDLNDVVSVPTALTAKLPTVTQ